MDEKDKKREELLKSAKFAEKYFSGLTKEHLTPNYIKQRYEKLAEKKQKGEAVDEQELFIWEFLFKNQEKRKKQKLEEEELFIWEFLFRDKKKK